MFTWIDGHLVLVLMICPIVATWAVGYVNFRLRIAARRRIFNRGGVR